MSNGLLGFCNYCIIIIYPTDKGIVAQIQRILVEIVNMLEGLSFGRNLCNIRQGFASCGGKPCIYTSLDDGQMPTYFPNIAYPVHSM